MYDIYTDFEYLVTVPIVNNVFLGFMIATLVLPFVFSFLLGFDESRNRPIYHNCVLDSILIGLATYTGTYPLRFEARDDNS